jgi:hypothetical protein
MENPGDVVNYNQNDVYNDVCYDPSSVGKIVTEYFKTLIDAGISKETAEKMTDEFSCQLMSKVKLIGEKPKISKERLINAVLNRETQK